MAQTTKVTLITIVAAFEIQERLVKDLRALKVRGYTLGKVNGFGVSGERMSGLADAPNMRIEILALPAMAQKILDRIGSKYAEMPVIAFSHEVEALPHDHFS